VRGIQVCCIRISSRCKASFQMYVVGGTHLQPYLNVMTFVKFILGLGNVCDIVPKTEDAPDLRALLTCSRDLLSWHPFITCLCPWLP
jgi:hypothetical protein